MENVKQILQIVKVNTRILMSKNYLIFIFVCLIVPEALNLSTTIYFEMIIPMSGGFIFSNMMFIEKHVGIEKQYYMTSFNKGYIFLIRTAINFIFYLIMAGVFYLYLSAFGLSGVLDEFAYSNLNLIELILFVGGVNYLFFGLVATLCSDLTNNPTSGLIGSLIYGLFWMGQYTNYDTLIINPFPYSAGNSDAYIYKIVYLLLTIFLVIGNYKHINNRFLCNGVE